MGKALDKIKHNWKVKLIIVCILGVFAGFIFYIDWIWDTQGQNLALLQISLFIAIIVAIVALWSLKTTRDSLELTRSTTRPFLNLSNTSVDLVTGFQPAPFLQIYFEIDNTGIYPADDVTVKLKLSKRNEQSHEIQTKYNFGIILPKGTRYEVHTGALTDINATKSDLENRWVGLSFFIEYRNKITNEDLFTRCGGQIVSTGPGKENYKYEANPDEYEWK